MYAFALDIYLALCAFDKNQFIKFGMAIGMNVT